MGYSGITYTTCSLKRIGLCFKKIVEGIGGQVTNNQLNKSGLKQKNREFHNLQ